MKEHFTLEAAAAGTKITRHTEVVAREPMKRLKELFFCIGIKRVHFFVFMNWRAQAE